MVRVCESSQRPSMRPIDSFELRVQAALADLEIKICIVYSLSKLMRLVSDY